MKILYLTSENINYLSSGVANKIKKQIDFLKSYNYEVIVPDDVEIKFGFFRVLLSLLPFTSNVSTQIISKKMKNINFDNVDIIYYRKTYLDQKLIKIFTKIKTKHPTLKIIMEIPTFPYDSELKIKYFFKKIKDKLYRKKIKSLIDRIVTFSTDESIFDVETLRVSNAINVTKNIDFENYKDDLINILCVARFDFWHGYDRIIKGLANYNSEIKDKVMLHFVGDGPELKKYKKLVEYYGLHNNVIFHGAKHGDELVEIYKKGNIGVDSLARHRSNVFYNSTLKGKEYAFYGLPIISGVVTEFDFVKDFKYYYRVPSNESAIDIDKILLYYKSIFHENMRKEIHEYAVNHFSYEKTHNNIIMYLKQVEYEKLKEKYNN